jgi:hypothetical protein
LTGDSQRPSGIGASESTHKEEVIDIQKGTGGNEGAPMETSPAPASRMCSPATPKSEIIEDSKIE